MSSFTDPGLHPADIQFGRLGRHEVEVGAVAPARRLRQEQHLGTVGHDRLERKRTPHGQQLHPQEVDERRGDIRVDRRLWGVQNPLFETGGGEKRMRIRQPTQSLQLPGQLGTRQTQSKPIQIDSCRTQVALQVVCVEEFVQGEQTGWPAVLLRQLAGQERFPEPFGPANIRSRGVWPVMMALVGAATAPPAPTPPVPGSRRAGDDRPARPPRPPPARRGAGPRAARRGSPRSGPRRCR